MVVYRPDVKLLRRTLESFIAVCASLTREVPVCLYLIDNGGLPNLEDIADELTRTGIDYKVLTGHGNVGYGRGHNLAIEQVASRYHLILNPDIEIEPDALARALSFLDEHAEAGLLAPAVIDDAGKLQYLCRQYPTLTVLFLRGFLPQTLVRLFSGRLAQYEMHAEINERDTFWDPPIVSGCFMLFRSEVLKKLKGFDPRYFLYFEDYDLSLRTHEVARVVYVPAVRVLHHGGGAARKGMKHIRMFVGSAFKFFNRFGWKWL